MVSIMFIQTTDIRLDYVVRVRWIAIVSLIGCVRLLLITCVLTSVN